MNEKILKNISGIVHIGSQQRCNSGDYVLVERERSPVDGSFLCPRIENVRVAVRRYRLADDILIVGVEQGSLDVVLENERLSRWHRDDTTWSTKGN
jgi:hypothetical protein